MAIIEIENKENFAFLFMNIHGGGWSEKLIEIISKELKPEKIESKLNKAGWHSSDSKIFFSINGIEYIIHLDEMDSIEIYSEDKNCQKETIKSIADLIDKKTTANKG
jgi:hypothetical protein